MTVGQPAAGVGSLHRRSGCARLTSDESRSIVTPARSRSPSRGIVDPGARPRPRRTRLPPAADPGRVEALRVGEQVAGQAGVARADRAPAAMIGGGVASQAPSAVTRAAPADAEGQQHRARCRRSTQSRPRPRPRRAGRPRGCASSSPVSEASSSAFGLSRSGRVGAVPHASRSAGRRRCRPRPVDRRACSCAVRSAYQSSGAPGGSEPDSTTQSPRCERAEQPCGDLGKHAVGEARGRGR